METNEALGRRGDDHVADSDADGVPGWLRFDRFDRWGLGLLLGVIVVGSVVANVAMPLRDWIGGDPVSVPYDGNSRVAALDRAGIPYGTATVSARVPEVDGGARAMVLVAGLFLALLIVAAGWLVVRLMRDVASGEPFTVANVWRLYGLAGILIVGAPVAVVVRGVADSVVLSGRHLDDVESTFSLPLVPMAIGLVFALLGEAFRAGLRLRADVEGLV